MDNYILAYYQKIKSGEIVVGKWIMLWYEYIIQGLEKGAFFYNAKKAQVAVTFIERFCRHHEGALAPQLIKLELWQKAMISVIFGIVDESGARQFREAVVEIARKNGKTLLAAAVSAYMAFLDGEYGGRIYYAAPKLEQANLCYDAFFQMISKDPVLSQKAKRRRSDIYIADSNTTAKPLANSAKRSDGLNCSLVVADEIAAWVGDQGLKFYEVLRSSFGARRQPLLMSISTAGYVNDGIFDELIKRSTAVLLGNSKETRLAPFLYTIDDIEKWNDINELRKSNPNLGVSVSVSYLLEEITIAEGSLSKKNEFLVKYTNTKASSSCAWLDYQTVEKSCGPHLSLEDFRNSYCVGGIDLSKSVDLTSCCIVLERDGLLHVFSKFFMPRSRLETAIAEDEVPYNIFVERGLLTLSGENHVDYNDVHQWFLSLVRDYKIMPLYVGYDRYSAQYLVDAMKQDGFKMDDVYQGTNLSPVINDTEGAAKDGLLRIGDNDLLKSHLLNSAMKTDIETQRRRLIKLGTRTRIDGTAALLCAMCMRSKYWSQVGQSLKNEKR